MLYVVVEGMEGTQEGYRGSGYYEEQNHLQGCGHRVRVGYDVPYEQAGVHARFRRLHDSRNTGSLSYSH